MAQQSVSNLAGAAMRIYDKEVHEQVFTKNVLQKNVLSNIAKHVGATTKYLSHHYARNIGTAAMGETDTLPTAGYQRYVQGNIPMKYNFHQMSITDVALTASRKSKEFLVDVLESEYQGCKDDMARQITRQWYSIGTGEICKVNGDPGGGTTVNLDNPMVGKNPTDYLEINSYLRFGATATTVGTIDSITDGDTFELTAAVGAIADNDAVYNAVSGTQSSKDNEMMGLKGLIDDNSNITTLQGISRDDHIWWKSYVNSSTSQRALTDSLMHTTFLECKKKGNPTFALTSFDVYKSYGLLLTPDRRYTNADSPLKGGFVGLVFNNIPIIADYDCPYDEMYFIDPSTLTVEDLAQMSFLNEDGAILDRSSTSPLWNATLKYYANLAITASNRNAALRDVT